MLYVFYDAIMEGAPQKSRHASRLFNELSKFQKCGILCDVTITGQLRFVQAHRVVLNSARLSEADDLAASPLSIEKVERESLIDGDDGVWIDEAYSPCELREQTLRDLERPHDPTPERPASLDSPEARLTALDSFRRHHCFCDVTLETDICTCDAHKVVLAASSDYFRAMFTCGMREHDLSRIPLRGINGAYVKRVLDYIYSGELSFRDWEDGLEMLKVAVFFQISSMIQLCVNKLLSRVNASNACALVQQGRELALKALFETSLEFLHDHFLELDACEVRVELLHADDIIQLLRSDLLGRDLRYGAELSVLRVVQRWILRKQPVNPATEDRILSYVRFPLISPRDVITTSRQVLCECDDASCSSFSSMFKMHLLKALQYHEKLHIQPLLQSPSSKIRCGEDIWLTVDGVMTPSPVKILSGSKFLNNENLGEAEAPIRDPFHSVLVINGFVFVLGGTRKVDEGYSQEVLRYDPRLDEWIKAAPMLVARGDFVAVTFGKLMFVIGGRNRNGALRSCECYNPHKNAWKEVAGLPECTYMAAGMVAEEKIYVTGGFNNYETTGKTFCYDPAVNLWDQIYTPMMSERGYHVIAKGHDDRLWVVGGVDNPFSGRNVWEVEAFDLKTRSWMYVGQILPSKLLLTTIRLNVHPTTEGHIFISAVTYPENYSALKFDPNQNMWLEVKEGLDCVHMDAPT